MDSAQAFLVAQSVKNPRIVQETSCNTGGQRSFPGLERSPGERNGYPLRYSCLENPMHREAWQATVHRVTKGQKCLKQHYTHKCRIFSSLWQLCPSGDHA